MRLVSQEVLYTHNDNISLDSTLSHLLVEWGQWIDHDLALTPQSPSTAAFRTAVDCTRSCSRDTPCFPIQVTRPAPPRGHALPPPGDTPCHPQGPLAGSCSFGLEGLSQTPHLNSIKMVRVKTCSV